MLSESRRLTLMSVSRQSTRMSAFRPPYWRSQAEACATTDERLSLSVWPPALNSELSTTPSRSRLCYDRHQQRGSHWPVLIRRNLLRLRHILRSYSFAAPFLERHAVPALIPHWR